MPARITAKFASLLCSATVAASAAAMAYQKTTREIARSTFRSVALIATYDAQGQPLSLGSGFLVSPRVIVTNLHVIRGASTASVRMLGQARHRPILGTVGIDAVHDLALLAMHDDSGVALPIGASVAIGDTVFAVGNPQGLEGTFSQGIVSGLRKYGTDTLIQITAPLSPGSSGGPVIDVDGKVVGVAAAALIEGQNLNFAVPAEYVSALLRNQVPVTSLPVTKASPSTSVLERVGTKSVDGVVAEAFAWGDYSSFTFTLRNRLDRTVSRVKCLVSFIGADDRPVDFREVLLEEPIPPGLGIRVDRTTANHIVRKAGDGTTSRPAVMLDESVVSLTRRVSFRILDFRIEP